MSVQLHINKVSLHSEHQNGAENKDGLTLTPSGFLASRLLAAVKKEQKKGNKNRQTRVRAHVHTHAVYARPANQLAQKNRKSQQSNKRN